MPPIPELTDALRLETERLRWSWDRHPEEHLDRYLARGVQDPRINPQSILTRALLADTLFPNAMTALIDAEWVFGVCLTWLVKALEDGKSRAELLNALEEGNTGVIPEYLLSTRAVLQDSGNPMPDYITDALFRPPGDDDEWIFTNVIDTFAWLWRDALAVLDAPKLRVVEAACGSANDYRQFADHGLARFLDYTGFDISRKNIANAHDRFPDVPFNVGNVFQIQAEDASIDYLVVHDLFEHLSPEGLEAALAEVTRVTVKEAWLAFFDMDAIPEHRIEPVDDYYINTLSADQVTRSLMRRARSVEVVDIAELTRRKTGFDGYHNPNAKTLIVEM